MTRRLQMGMLAAGVVGAAAWVAGLILQVDKGLMFRAYLFAYLFCLGLSLGSLSLLMLHNLTGGEWGVRIGAAARAGALALPLLAVLFVPICLGLRWLYPWARPEEVAGDHTLLHRQPYLNVGFFYARAAAYFAIWIALAFLLRRPRPATRALSAAGLILYLLTMTHAGIDWVMSRDVAFYSTAFGFLLTVGQTLSALALAVVLVPILPAAAARRLDEPRPALLNDLGNLLMTLVILWAYVSFMQLLVIWMGNTREDNTWYLERGLGGGGDSTAWRIVAVLLLVFHFFVPFYLMLFRKAKQDTRVLRATAWVLLAAHVVEQYWLVAPSDHGGAAVFDPHWVDLAAWVGMVGLWSWGFFWMVERGAVVDVTDAGRAEEGAASHA